MNMTATIRTSEFGTMNDLFNVFIKSTNKQTNTTTKTTICITTVQRIRLIYCYKMKKYIYFCLASDLFLCCNGIEVSWCAPKKLKWFPRKKKSGVISTKEKKVVWFPRNLVTWIPPKKRVVPSSKWSVFSVNFSNFNVIWQQRNCCCGC